MSQKVSKTIEKILENLVCGVIVGSVISMVPCILVILVMLMPGGDRFYELAITITCPLATLSSVAFFCYLDFIRKPSSAGTVDDDPKVYKWIGFFGETIGACFPIIVWLR